MSQPSRLRPPLDPFPYPQDPRSVPAHSSVSDGQYAYVQNEQGVNWIVPDGPHVHPKVLGQAREAMYAGDLTITGGTITDLTNLSGTFQFDDPDGLLAAADQFEHQGLRVGHRAVRYFPPDGSPPIVLR